MVAQHGDYVAKPLIYGTCSVALLQADTPVYRSIDLTALATHTAVTEYMHIPLEYYRCGELWVGSMLQVAKETCRHGVVSVFKV
jgi:hypothetical protein